MKKKQSTKDGRHEQMTDEAKRARAEYQREYKRRNADRINAYNRAWRKAHPEKTKQYNANYWTKQANKKES